MSVEKKYLHDVNLVNNKLINPLLNPLTTVERANTSYSFTAAQEGYATYDTDENLFYFWNGSAWQTIGGGTFGKGEWGSITGTLSAQTDLTSYLSSTYTPLNRNITINGITQNLSTDRTWTITGLPSQTGNSGKYLTTDGVNASWATVSGGSAVWGGITGTLTAQTDLTAYLAANYYPLATNPAGYIDFADLSAGTGISYNNLTGVITNSAPDQTVALTAGTGIGITGTYPNFTIANNNPFTSPLTTKGDIYVRNATIDTRLPVGLDTQVLLADSSTATGLKWGTNTAVTPTGYYGAFSDVTDQTAAVINTGYPMLLGVTDLSNGVTVVSGSRVTIANTGIYNIQWSAQFRNPTASEHDVIIWLRKNGVDVPGSSGVVLVPAKHGSSDGHTLPSWNFLLDVVGGDYYEFVWSTANTSVFISFEPAGSPPPSTASVVLTVTQQSGIMAGTGITAINGLTGAVQTLATGTSGLAPLFTSTGTTHTLDIPLASATGVTAGLLSNTDYNNFGARAAGGSFVAYYFNGSVPASVATYYQMSPVANIGAAANFTLAGNGLISQWLSDVGNPNRIEIPAGNWNFEMYMSASSAGGTPAFYVELLKYDGVTFTSIATSSAAPKNITGGTSIDLYLTSLAIPQTTLLVTDRLAIRVYIVNSIPGRSITMYTQDSHASEVITNFAGGIAALNGLSANTQYFATGTTGTDFAISSTSATHTFNLPTASATNTGKLSSTDWGTFNGKIGSDATLLGYNGLGSAIKAYPLGINLTAVGASTQFTNQRLWLTPVYVGADSTITGVRWLQIALGNYTANNYNGVGLYTVSGGTITLVASSTNNGNIWKTFTANTWGNEPFSTPYVATRGTYYIGALYNNSAQVTAPSVGNVSIAAATVQSFDFTGGRMYCYSASQLTLPASVALSTTVGVTTAWYFALY